MTDAPLDLDEYISRTLHFKAIGNLSNKKHLLLRNVVVSLDGGISYYPFRDHMWVRRTGMFANVNSGTRLTFTAKVNKYAKAVKQGYRRGKAWTNYEEDYTVKGARPC